MNHIQEVYDKIIKETNKFGKYHKCLFHIHTPASGDDYATLEKYRENHGEAIGHGKKQIPHEEIISLCKEKAFFPCKTFSFIVKKIFEDNQSIYSNEDELLKYLLIAWEMIIHNIELAVISDHNVIDGYAPLNRAIDIMAKKCADIIKHNGYRCPTLLLGMEISCADKNHVVGIFDNKAEDKIRLFIEENIMSPHDGTYLTSMDVIREISKLGGIAYIAHSDTSNMFKEKFLSKAYTTKLLNMPELMAIGFSYRQNCDGAENSRERVKQYIKERTDKEFSFLLDADSHSIDTIGDRCFYIKGHKCDFYMIRDALLDNDIAISFSVPQKPQNYIKGLYVSNKNSQGFLISNGKNATEAFSIPLSSALNCFIGGRGTGKSTILNIIEAILGQNFLDENILNAIFEYDELWLLYSYQEDDYLISFMPRQPKYANDNAYADYKRICSDEHLFFWNSHDSKLNLSRLKSQILNDCVQVFKVGDKLTFNEVGKQILKKFYDMSYSINELVQTASSEKINDYIYRILEMNPDLKARRNKIKDIATLKRFLNNFDDIIKKRTENMRSKITGFNNSQYASNKIEITYKLNDKPNDELNNRFGLNDIFDDYKAVTFIGKEKFIEKTNLSLDGAIGFLLTLNKEYGNVTFAKKILAESINDEEHLLLKYTTPLTPEMADNNITILNDDNKLAVLKKINKYLIDKKIDNIINGFGDDYIRDIEFFSLKFNVMNKEGSHKRALFRDVRQLSLGQKVVAMLSFVLGYSDYTHDYRPLVIDQPEDNLDNQYIFKNLIDSLRKIRGKRQLIIATHNATIVTNAKAEQVIVMESDGAHGWVADKGYVTENRIKQHILNYMEGGKESFKHKINVYKDVLK